MFKRPYCAKLIELIIHDKSLKRTLSYCLNDWEKSNSYSNIAMIYLSLKDLSNAESYAYSAISSDSTQTYAWFITGKIKHAEGNVNEATIYYQKALAMAKMETIFQFELYSNYASCCLANNECDSAKKYVIKALDLFPESKPAQELNERINNCGIVVGD